MRKLIVLFFILIISCLIFYKKNAYFGFEEIETKSRLYVNNNTSKNLILKIHISISPETPSFEYEISAKEKKEIIIDWNLIRKTDLWGEGNIWLYIYNQKKEIDKIFIGEVELYEDGRNFINNFQSNIEIEF